MASDVQITVTMHQQMDTEEDVTESSVTGERYDVHGKTFLKYQEVIDETNRTSDTLVKIAQEEITVSRDGYHKMKLEFILGKRTRCNYPTPAGVMVIDIHTLEYERIEDEDSLMVRVVYTMEMNENPVSKNSLKIIAH